MTKKHGAMILMLCKIFRYLYIRTLSPKKRAAVYERLGVVMGKNCQVFPDVSFGSEPYLIQLGNNVKITNGCSFITHDGGIEVLRNIGILQDGDVFGPIKIGSNVFIGNRCIVLPGVTIGDNVVIGAGSIVTRDIPSNTVAAGVPARVINTISEYTAKILECVVHTKHMRPIEKYRYLKDKFGV